MKPKRYKIAGTYWIQKELKFRDNEKVRKILRGKIDLNDLSESKFGEIIDKLYDGGILREIMPIILKEDPNPLKRAWNSLIYRFRSIDKENMIQYMTDSEIARVAVDFFLFKSAWLTNLMPFGERSTFLMKAGSIFRKIIPLRKSASQSPEAI